MEASCGGWSRCGVCVIRPQGAAMIPFRVINDTISCDAEDQRPNG